MGFTKDIKCVVKKYLAYRKYKITGVKKYGKLSLTKNKDMMVAPFEIVHVDMVRPWNVKVVVPSRTLYKNIHALTMIDTATNWIEITATTRK